MMKGFEGYYVKIKLFQCLISVINYLVIGWDLFSGDWFIDVRFFFVDIFFCFDGFFLFKNEC